MNLILRLKHYSDQYYCNNPELVIEAVHELQRLHKLVHIMDREIQSLDDKLQAHKFDNIPRI